MLKTHPKDYFQNVVNIYFEFKQLYNICDTINYKYSSPQFLDKKETEEKVEKFNKFKSDMQKNLISISNILSNKENADFNKIDNIKSITNQVLKKFSEIEENINLEQLSKEYAQESRKIETKKHKKIDLMNDVVVNQQILIIQIDLTLEINLIKQKN